MQTVQLRNASVFHIGQQFPLVNPVEMVTVPDEGDWSIDIRVRQAEEPVAEMIGTATLVYMNDDGEGQEVVCTIDRVTFDVEHEIGLTLSGTGPFP